MVERYKSPASTRGSVGDTYFGMRGKEKDKIEALEAVRAAFANDFTKHRMSKEQESAYRLVLNVIFGG
jgi:hypothetical protein